MTLYDYDIRIALKRALSDKFIGTHTMIVDELQISWGDTRIDVAVINGSLHGYEIKSDRDTLDRLPRQTELYNKIFDAITLVCSNKLILKAKEIIPAWWGIQVPISDDSISDGVRFETEKEPQINKQVNIRSLLELTWKEEAITILSNYGLDRGYRSRPRWDIWDRIAEKIDPFEVKEAVRNCLRKRRGWRKPETLRKLYAD